MKRNPNIYKDASVRSWLTALCHRPCFSCPSPSQLMYWPSECDDEPIRPCAICQTALLDDPPPWECQACRRETCCSLVRCYQPGCHLRFCSHCLRDHAMRCFGRGRFTFRLCWPSGHCIQRLENAGDLSVEKLIQRMNEGLIQGLPRARTTSAGERLQSYRILHGTDVMQDGTSLSDYDLPRDASLTVVLVDHADVRDHCALNEVQG